MAHKCGQSWFSTIGWKCSRLNLVRTSVDKYLYMKVITPYINQKVFHHHLAMEQATLTSKKLLGPKILQILFIKLLLFLAMWKMWKNGDNLYIIIIVINYINPEQSVDDDDIMKIYEERMFFEFKWFSNRFLI